MNRKIAPVPAEWHKFDLLVSYKPSYLDVEPKITPFHAEDQTQLYKELHYRRDAPEFACYSSYEIFADAFGACYKVEFADPEAVMKELPVEFHDYAPLCFGLIPTLEEAEKHLRNYIDGPFCDLVHEDFALLKDYFRPMHEAHHTKKKKEAGKVLSRKSEKLGTTGNTALTNTILDLQKKNEELKSELSQCKSLLLKVCAKAGVELPFNF